jgi:ArsR family transcriptional regulator
MTPETLLALLADPTRLRIINLLSRGELCVCYFVEILGESQPKISRHLAALREAGVVKGRREGKWMHYSLATTSPIIDAIVTELHAQPQHRKDAQALENACCAVKLPAALRRAPRPRLVGEGR